MDTSMAEMRLVVTGDYEFEYREKSIIKALFGIFLLSGFRCKGKEWLISY